MQNIDNKHIVFYDAKTDMSWSTIHMSAVKKFARNLRDMLDALFPEEKGIVVGVMFNIVLVKFSARPGMFGDYYVHSDRLNDDPKFMSFITEDPDLAVGWFKTERAGYKDFVIYNRQFSHLFAEKDVSDKSNDEIHCIRGTRLGFPYVTPHFQNFALLSVHMLIQVSETGFAPFYSYRCPDDEEQMIKAMKLWLKFRKYADIIGHPLELVFSK